MKKYEYTYKIKYIDLLGVFLEVEYTATNASLTSYILSIPSEVKNEDGTFKDIEEIIKDLAPHDRWAAQESLMLRYDELINKTELVTI